LGDERSELEDGFGILGSSFSGAEGQFDGSSFLELGVDFGGGFGPPVFIAFFEIWAGVIDEDREFLRFDHELIFG